MSDVELAGVRVDNLTFKEALHRIENLIGGEAHSYVVTPNSSHIVMLQNDRLFAKSYRGADLVLPDGMPLIWASKLMRRPLKEKISGSDLMPALCEVASEKGYTVFLLGGKLGVAEIAKRELIVKYPSLRVAGTYSPPLGFEDDEAENEKILRIINDCRPDILFLGLGTPKQEKWIFRNKESYEAGISIGVGASFDFVAGTVERAPVWMQKSGLEWLWRLLREPRRLWKRYLIGNTVFIYLILRELFRKKERFGL